MSVLIFGLSGNPVHLGHMAAANEVSKFFDEVWMMVSNSSNTKNMIDAEQLFTIYINITLYRL